MTTFIESKLDDVDKSISVISQQAMALWNGGWGIERENEDGRLDKWLVSFRKGTRTCPGIKIAWVEMRLSFAHIFRKFDLKIDKTANITDAYNIDVSSRLYRAFLRIGGNDCLFVPESI